MFAFAYGITLDIAYLAGRIVTRLLFGTDHCRCGEQKNPYRDTTGKQRCALCAMEVRS